MLTRTFLNNMLWCKDCNIEMKCTKTGYGLRFGAAHVYPGDLFKCPSCETEVIKTGSSPTHDPERKIQTLQAPG